MLHFFDHVSSTNDCALDEKYHHGDIIWAEHQSKGRGQRGNSWISGSGLNITLSVVVEPEQLPIREQFSLLRVAALAIVNTLADFDIEAKIKWTNDIYVGDKKICGILIENQIKGGHVRRSIIGIGLNINQIEFSPELPNPTSMTLETNREFDRKEVIEALHKHLMELTAMDNWETLSQPYHTALYRLGEWHQFSDNRGTIFTAKINSVAPTGEITLTHNDNTQRSYLFRELHFII